MADLTRSPSRASRAAARASALAVACSWLVSLAVACAPVETPEPTSPTTPAASAQGQEQALVQREAQAQPAVRTGAPEPAAAAPTLNRHEITVDGHAIAVWEKRPPAPTRAILLIHGRTWSSLPDFDLRVEGEHRSFMDALAARGFAVYAVDLRGYGATRRDATGWLTPDRAATDVEFILEWMTARERSKIKQAPVLFGWSMGSLVSHLVVQRRPDLVSDVVLFGYPRGPTHNNKPTPSSAKPARKVNTAEAAASDFISPKVISKAAIDAYVEQSLAADPVKVDWRDFDQFNVLDPAKIKVPTLLIQGARDPYAPVKVQAKVFARLGHPDRRWVLIPGGDHAAHIEDTMNLFVGAMVEFLERPRAPRAGGTP